MIALTKTGWHPVGQRIGSLLTWINKPFSRGKVWLDSTDPGAEPQVAFQHLSDYRDVQRLQKAMLFIARLYDQPALARTIRDPFPTSYSERIRDLGQVNLKNRVLTSILATMMDGPAVLRRFLIDNVVAEGATYDQIRRDEAARETFVREKVHGIWHASGTCRIGGRDDREAVVDAAGRVIGVEGLRVVDGSVIPFVPCANTNFPILMIAEKMADAILADAGGRVGG